MSSISYGDLASSLSTTRLTTQIKKDLEKYTYEVSSGKQSDLSEALSGDFTSLAAIERSLRSLSAYETAQGEAALFTATQQTIAGHISEQISSVSLDLIEASNVGTSANMSIVSASSRSKLGIVISTLNTNVSGRYVMGGTATSTPPLNSAAEILGEISTLVASETTASDVIQAVDDWFNISGGGFETTGYQGSDTHLSQFSLGDTEVAGVSLKADEPSMRDIIKGLVLASLVDTGMFTNDLTQQAFLIQTAGETLLATEADLLDLQSQIGTTEEQISNAQAARSSEEYALELAKAELISSDVFEAANSLTQAETQLEMMYTITARLSQLKLSDYI